ncbi:MAG: twin-arginine translocase subunit TatC [Anaerolineales bacterium]|nr:twin-arginine translocase subunit TatC [Anaerolineales bacterium]
MRKFFYGLWRLITVPFRLLWWVISFPFRAYRQIQEFLTEEPDEHALMDVVSGVVTDKDIRQAMWDQVEDLRKHLLRSLLGLALAVSVSFTFTQSLIGYLAQPVGGLETLRAIEVTESIGVFMKVALLSGLAISLPYIAFEFWLFAAPGLRPGSRRFGLIAIPLATFLFICGMAFAYYIMMPAALPFLLNFMGIQAELRPASYFNFITGVMFWIGVAFEFPLVIYVLTAIGFVKPRVLSEHWRIAIVVIAILAAAITPTVDPVNMALVMAPMSLLYFVSIGLSFIAYRGRIRREGRQEIPQEGE